MNNSSILDILSLSISCFALAVSVYTAILHHKKIKIEIKHNKENKRFEFLKDFLNSLTYHNWKFIEHYEFEGIYPDMDSLLLEIPDKDSKENQKKFGKRIVTLEHLNILLRIYANKEVLIDDDIIGYSNWANEWYNNSREALRTILKFGDIFPYDFIEWLYEVIFFEKKEDFINLCGPRIQAKLKDEHTKKNNERYSKSKRIKK